MPESGKVCNTFINWTIFDHEIIAVNHCRRRCDLTLKFLLFWNPMILELVISNYFGITFYSNPIRNKFFCYHIILVVKDLNSLSLVLIGQISCNTNPNWICKKNQVCILLQKYSGQVSQFSKFMESGNLYLLSYTSIC